MRKIRFYQGSHPSAYGSKSDRMIAHSVWDDYHSDYVVNNIWCKKLGVIFNEFWNLYP